jgi:hypothetical protein
LYTFARVREKEERRQEPTGMENNQEIKLLRAALVGTKIAGQNGKIKIHLDKRE